MNFRVGNTLVGVGYDSEIAAKAIDRVCAEFDRGDSDDEIPAALGLRAARVGLSRRTVWLVHHGSPVRHRAESLDDAAAFLRGLLGGIDRAIEDEELELPLRVFSRGERAVLVHVPRDVHVDERRLRKRGIEQLPSWSGIVVPTSGDVRYGGRNLKLSGIVVGRTSGSEPMALDEIQKFLAYLAFRHQLQWAWLLDGLGDKVLASEMVDRTVARMLR